MKFAGVVVWYNPTDNDKKNIYSYLPGLDKLYIIDNSDEENSFKLDKKIEYIFNGENKGIAKALNIAAKKSLDNGYEWLLTMDQDTVFEFEKLEELKKYIDKKEEKIAIICPWLDTKLKIKKSKQKIDYPLDVMTSGNLLNLNVYRKIGGFLDDFFIDGVDMEYCLRLKKYGYKIKRINIISIKHNLGNIFYKKFFKKNFLCMNHNYVRYYYRVRNYHYIYDLYYKNEPEYCNSILKFRAMIWCIIFYEKDKYRKLRAVYDGYKDYKKNIKGKYYH